MFTDTRALFNVEIVKWPGIEQNHNNNKDVWKTSRLHICPCIVDLQMMEIKEA